MSASVDFLKGRRVNIDGFTFRDDDGIEHLDVFHVIGQAATRPDDWVAVQDVIDGQIEHVPASLCHPI